MEKKSGIDIIVLPRWNKLVSDTTTTPTPTPTTTPRPTSTTTPTTHPTTTTTTTTITTTQTPIPLLGQSEEDVQVKGVRFPIREDINEKLVLWQGDIRLIEVDAVVNSTNETMSDTTGISGAILDAAGPEVRDEIAKLEHCRTGEARLTRAYNLPSRYIIHTVGPRYNEKYKTAAENALHNCYRSSLELLKENNLRTIAFPVIQSQKRGYPPESGCHISVRTVRRFLEHWGHNIDVVIFCVSNASDFTMYSKVLSLYCPRNKAELMASKEELPRDVGNQFGETVVEDRKIRISAFPGGVANTSLVNSPTVITESFPNSPRIIQNETLPGQFAFMKADFDEERKKKFEKMSKEEKAKLEQQQLYLNYLYKAQGMDLSDIARLSIIYESGKDSLGRPVVVIVGSRLPTARAQLDRVFMYLIRVMDKITDNYYVVVYLHTNMEERETPEISWLKKVYNIIDSKYGDHLSVFYVVHPSFWLKVFEGVLSSIMTNDYFWKKVHYIERLGDIYNNIEHDQLVLPEHVIQYDSKINGTRSGNQQQQQQHTRNYAQSPMDDDL